MLSSRGVTYPVSYVLQLSLSPLAPSALRSFCLGDPGVYNTNKLIVNPLHPYSVFEQNDVKLLPCHTFHFR